jgi:integrase
MVFRLYVLPRFGAVPLDAISQREVRAWVTSLTVRGLPKVEHEEMRYLNPAEIACLAEAIRPGYQALVSVGASGGLRIGELAGLRRSRVDLDAGTVNVAETVVEVEGWLLFGPPKTRAGRRRIGLPRRVVEELALHLRAPGRPTDPVFRSPAGGPLRVTGFRNRIWRPATLAAGLPGLRPHDLRHTRWRCGSRPAPPEKVAVRAGHTSTSFVLDRYGHLYPESDAALRDRLDAIYSAGQRDQGADVVELSRERSRPQRSPGTRRAPPALDR